MRRRLPWIIWIVAVVLAVLGAAALYISIASPAALPWMLSLALIAIAAASAGAVVADRVPGNPVGWLLLALGTGTGVMGFSIGYSELGFAHAFGGPLPAATFAAWLSTWISVPVFYGIPAFLLLLFPDGKLPSRRWHWIARFVAIAIAIATVAATMWPSTFDNGIDNPLAPTGSAAEFSRWLYDATNWLAPPVMISAAAALIVRLRRSRGAERQQLKWFAYAATLAAVLLGLSVITPSVISDIAFLGGLYALGGLPVATGMAILRYRLYAIDIVINKTLVYGALTITLGAAYLGIILLLQLALNPLTQGSGLAIAASTLAVAALFRPARTRIQSFVDRRFYRHRYDAAHTLDVFGQRLRHDLDLENLAADLQNVVHETMQPAHVTLWLRRADQ